VLTPAELALLGPADVAGLERGANGRTRATRSNGRRTSGSSSTAATGNGAAKKTTARRTTKRTGG
jgi:hypothetical protein